MWCLHLFYVNIGDVKQWFCNLERGHCMIEKELALKIITADLPKYAIFRVKIFGIWVKISIPIDQVIDFLKGGK